MGAATRTARQLERKVERVLRQSGAGAALLTAARKLVVPVGIIVAGHQLSQKLQADRAAAILKAAQRYRMARGQLKPPISGQWERLLADNLRRELERINDLYDQRGIEERQN